MKQYKIILVGCLCLLMVVTFAPHLFVVTCEEDRTKISGMPCENPEQFQGWYETYEQETSEEETEQSIFTEEVESDQEIFETIEENEDETTLETEIETKSTIEEITSPQLTYLGQYRITFYDNCPACCGQWAYMGITNSGAPCRANHTIACGPEIPFGTIIYIEGLGTYVCEDRGVPSGCVDIYVNNHGEIPSWGVGYFNCYIVN